MARDDAATAPFNLSHQVMHLLSSSLEHLLTISSLAGELRSMPPYTLARAAIENAAAALYLLTPAERKERVRRLLHYAAADEADRDIAHRLSKTSMTPSKQERLDHLARIGEAAGLSRDLVLGSPKSWTGIVQDAGQHLDERGKDVELLWRLCSGFTHGRTWAMLSTLERGEELEREDGSVIIEMRASISVLSACVELSVLLVDMALQLSERASVVWTGSGPDVEKDPDSEVP